MKTHAGFWSRERKKSRHREAGKGSRWNGGVGTSGISRRLMKGIITPPRMFGGILTTSAKVSTNAKGQFVKPVWRQLMQTNTHTYTHTAADPDLYDDFSYGFAFNRRSEGLRHLITTADGCSTKSNTSLRDWMYLPVKCCFAFCLYKHTGEFPSNIMQDMWTSSTLEQSTADRIISSASSELVCRFYFHCDLLHRAAKANILLCSK